MGRTQMAPNDDPLDDVIAAYLVANGDKIGAAYVNRLINDPTLPSPCEYAELLGIDPDDIRVARTAERLSERAHDLYEQAEEVDA